MYSFSLTAGDYDRGVQDHGGKLDQSRSAGDSLGGFLMPVLELEADLAQKIQAFNFPAEEIRLDYLVDGVL